MRIIKTINEIGNKYGRLIVIEKTSSKDNRACWLCQCECGNQIIVAGKLLRNGHVQSCGCLKRDKTIKRNISNVDNLIGQRFGKLVVIAEGQLLKKASGKNVRTWICQCDCGNTCKVQTQYLRNGDTSSCGCIHSKGEAEIARFLNSHHIKYKQEFIVPNFIYENGGIPRFDFALFDNDNNLLCLIEYQGNIHFNYSNSGWNTKENFEIRKKHDDEKLIFCKNYSIILYRINYFDNIKEEMEKIYHEQYENNN